MLFTVDLVPDDKGIRGVTEEKHATTSIINNGSEFTAASAEMVRKLSGVLRSIMVERAKGLLMASKVTLKEMPILLAKTASMFGDQMAHCSARQKFLKV